MQYKLSKRSLDNLKGVHPDMVNVVKRAIEITTVDFGITEGLRTKQRQAQLVAEKKSQTLNSRHITGHAVDVMAYVRGKGSWDWELYEEINKAFQQAAKELRIKVVWGGSWTSLRDGPHFELDRRFYP
jgi:peptidoglycan L-alanyl-D-glutamate endopeptidase CwlK